MNPKILTWSILSVAFACGASFESRAADNPQNHVGIEHNLYLECLMRNGGGATKVALRALVERCKFDPGMPVDEFVELYGGLLDGDPLLKVAERMQPYRSLYTEEQFAFFDRIDQALALTATPAEADRALAGLEQEAIARFPGRDDAEASLLALLSTARHSLAFWTGQGASLLETRNGRVEAQRLKWWQKVLIVLGADAAGAGIGFLVGGPVGAGAIGAGASSGTGSAL